MPRCIRCGKGTDEARIGVMVDAPAVHCSECDEEVSVEEIEEHLAEWGRLLRWLKAHPARTPEPAAAE
jgi:hypothetical protein